MSKTPRTDAVLSMEESDYAGGGVFPLKRGRLIEELTKLARELERELNEGGERIVSYDQQLADALKENAELRAILEHICNAYGSLRPGKQRDTMNVRLAVNRWVNYRDSHPKEL